MEAAEADARQWEGFGVSGAEAERRRRKPRTGGAARPLLVDLGVGLAPPRMKKTERHKDVSGYNVGDEISTTGAFPCALPIMR